MPIEMKRAWLVFFVAKYGIIGRRPPVGEIELESVMEDSLGQEKRRAFDIPMKYEIPIVAADIHARETLGFSSFNSKSIINLTLMSVTVHPSWTISFRTYPNPLLIVPSEALNHRLACLSGNAIAVKNLITFFFLRPGLGENFFSLARFFTFVVISVGDSC
jgi:hypothetical protein